MIPEQFRHILGELISENPLAISPLLRILEICFTTEVPTMAVTLEERPRLLVNLSFVDEHCKTDAHVKAVILHEFLHILLRHTEKKHPVSDAEHLAMDAVINAIIHRQVGDEASSMMAAYYGKETGIMRLLRPRIGDEPDVCRLFDKAWTGLYDGRLVVDDIHELAEELSQPSASSAGPSEGVSGIVLERLLGNHSGIGSELPEAIKEALDRSLRTMNGAGVWRAPHSRGVGAALRDTQIASSATAVERWVRETFVILRRYVMPNSRSPLLDAASVASVLPVLTTGDRRSFLRAMWSPFLPEAVWLIEKPRPAGRTQIYLDVSGSMDAEMPHVIALLNRLRHFIKMPFWAFSTDVRPAVISKGVLVTGTTGGTSIECVLRHIGETRPRNAVIVTDGYIELVDRGLVRKAAGTTRIHAIVTRDGSTNMLDRAGLTCTQLGKVPS